MARAALQVQSCNLGIMLKDMHVWLMVLSFGLQGLSVSACSDNARFFYLQSPCHCGETDELRSRGRAFNFCTRLAAASCRWNVACPAGRQTPHLLEGALRFGIVF